MIRRTHRTAPAKPTPAPAAVAWPEGVIARYLTAAGTALTDTAIAVEIRPAAIPGEYRWHCTGCGESDHISWHEERSRELAQGHARTCTGLPRP